MQQSDKIDDTYCAAPWVNIHVSTRETLQPCCAGAGIYLDLDQLSRYNDDQDLLSIKKQFLDNQTPSICIGCQERNWYSQFIGQSPTGVGDFTLLSLDLRWSNTCQLTCMYCDEGASSSWAALKNRGNTIPIYRIQSRDSLLNLIDQHKSTIKRISLLGGEPLLIKENLKVLEILDSDIEVNIFTGLNVNLENNPIFNTLLEMPNVYWTISMENVGEKFEFVRRGATWDQQVKNIDYLISKKQSRYTCNFQSQFCAYSATSLIELYDFVENRDIKINWNWFSSPSELDFTNFPDRLKYISLDQLKQIKSHQNRFSYMPQVDEIIDRLYKSLGQGSENHLSICKQWHERIESQYFDNRFDFQSLWPEFTAK